MSRILNLEPNEDILPLFGAREWYVCGRRFNNASAKFWSALMDEIAADHPACDRFMVGSGIEAVFSEEQLFPRIVLDDDMFFQNGHDLAEIFRDAVREMELFGTPGVVSVQLKQGERLILEKELPLDCVDSETFPFLVVWLLEWSGIPSSEWNNETVDGGLLATDVRRRISYSMEFSLDRRHLSEGLYRCTLDARFARSLSCDMASDIHDKNDNEN